MRKALKIWLGILFIVVILIGSVVIWQWNNITAVIDSFRYSQEEVEQKLEENKKELQQYIDENESITVRDLTEEEAKALQEGNLSEEEAIAILTGKEPPKPNNGTQTESQPDPDPDDGYSAVVSEAIAKLYIQKNTYLGKLDAIEAQVRAEYVALVKDSGMTDEEKKEEKNGFLKRNLSMVADWERECDSVVNGILAEIEAALKAENQDTAIVAKLKQAYLDEKRLKKSYFINRYMD